jgi:hypothetical protein
VKKKENQGNDKISKLRDESLNPSSQGQEKFSL